MSHLGRAWRSGVQHFGNLWGRISSSLCLVVHSQGVCILDDGMVLRIILQFKKRISSHLLRAANKSQKRALMKDTCEQTEAEPRIPMSEKLSELEWSLSVLYLFA
jgi:hypothetical protein